MDKLARHYLDHLKKSAGAMGRGLVRVGLPALSGYAAAKANYDPNDPYVSQGIGAVFGATGALTGHEISAGMEARALKNKLPAPSFNAKALAHFLPIAGLDVLGSRSATALQHVSQNASAQAALATQQTKDLTGGGATQGILDYLKNNPGHVAAGAGATALGAAGLYALLQGGRAAKRIGDGHALRVSTSLRKRPGQSTDLNLGLSPMAAGRLGRGGRTRPGEGEDVPVDEGKDED